MQILFRKVSDERHTLQIVRDNGAREEVECETRSYLVHDLLHYAVEAEAGLSTGFWGRLAGGSTLAEMNDRTGDPATRMDGEMGAIERVVGVLSGVTKGRSATDLADGMHRFAVSIGAAAPGWLTVSFIEAVQERMRHLLGRWRSTLRGQTMDLPW